MAEEFDLTALSEGLEAAIEDLRYPNGRRKILINYELYCRTCKHYWSQPEYEPKIFKCKNGHLTVRILSQYEILEDTHEGISFDDIQELMYN